MNQTPEDARLLALALVEYLEAGGKANVPREHARVTFELEQVDFLDKVLEDSKSPPGTKPALT